MRYSAAARVCCSILLLSAAGCSDAREADTDSALCARYKRALLRYRRVDPHVTSQTVDGSYDAYRCPWDDAPDVRPSLAECAARLEEQCSEGSSCDVDLLTLKPACARGLLILVQKDASLSHDGIGAECSMPGFMPGSHPGLSFIDGASRQCETEQCLSFQGGPPRCTCRCSTRYDEPTCECPSQFRCRTDLTADSNTVHEGYCIPAAR